jgi:menaquinone-dependent protoporphyrinogen oxidase
MTVLVAAASKHGATDEIAERIGADLTRWGFEVEVRKLADVDDVCPYEAIVLGSAIFYGKWMKEAIRFVATHAHELAERPTWLFGSGSITGNPPLGDDPNAIQPSLVQKLVTKTHAREHKVFAGKLDSNTLSLAELLPVRMARGREGDWRNWQAIDEWAARIAGELEPDRGRPNTPIRDDGRASGEDAIKTREGNEAEATPSRMNRLKTSRL